MFWWLCFRTPYLTLIGDISLRRFLAFLPLDKQTCSVCFSEYILEYCFRAILVCSHNVFYCDPTPSLSHLIRNGKLSAVCSFCCNHCAFLKLSWLAKIVVMSSSFKLLALMPLSFHSSFSRTPGSTSFCGCPAHTVSLMAGSWTKMPQEHLPHI